MANYPVTVSAFSTKVNDQVIDPAHVNDLQNEIMALEGALLTSGLAHNLKFVDATYDIGASGAFRPRDLYLSRNFVLGGGASAGELRLLEPSGSGTNFTAFKAQAQGADITYILPATVGALGQVLGTADGTGTLAWVAAGGGESDQTVLPVQIFS